MSSNILIPWWSTSFDNGEDLAVMQAIRNKNISQGDLTAELERLIGKYLGVPHVIAVTSGSSALLLALLANNIKPGDEVIVPNRTWVATAHAVKILGAKPIFVDTESAIQIIDIDKIEPKITKNTKAIIPVYMNGHSINIEKIRQIIGGRDIRIIEDAAQALGSKNINGDFLGTLGDAGCFSLSVAKIISTGQGGFVVTNNDEIAFRLRNMRTHGVENTIQVDEWGMLGFNFRFTDILASIGIIQLGLLDKRVERLKEIQSIYSEGLHDNEAVKLMPNSQNEIGPYIEVVAAERAVLMKKLKRNGIESRAFYPNLNLAHYMKSSQNFINSIRFNQDGLYLPSGPALTNNQIDKVLTVMKEMNV